ncbi:MAG: glycoside hydrolase family 15 protein, partial [Steroidobacteraceae bacterium]
AAGASRSAASPRSHSSRLDPALSAPLDKLLRADLAFTLAHGSEPCYDIWEEEIGLHYYTLRVAAAALEEGAEWLTSAGESREAAACRAQAARLLAELDGFWLPDAGFLRSRVLPSGARSAKELDISVVLAVLHAYRSDACAPSRDADRSAHSVHDPHVHATLERLEALFEAEYPINRSRPAGGAPALGRYAGDRYYSGGAYYFATLAAAEINFRAGAAPGQPRSGALLARGNAYLETVRAFTPPSGDLSEQFDRQTGAQTSAKHLAWSYAAFITCMAAKRAAERRI